jgi:hypothetical protein
MNLTCISYILYIHGLKVILYNILNNFVHDIKFNGMEFSTCGTVSALKKFWILEHFGFYISGLGMLNLDLYFLVTCFFTQDDFISMQLREESQTHVNR